MTTTQAAFDELLAEATGRSGREAAVLPRTGGPAGNARLTAWTGLLVLVLIAAQLITLLDVSGLIGWHVVLGTLLVPPALLKTATTGWRLVGYYRGRPHYQVAGPPPLVLRVLGPAVVVTTLSFLASGLTLVALGPDTGRSPFLTVLGHGVSALSVHQLLFFVWGTVTGLHLLARFVPALRLTVLRPAAAGPVPGAGHRLLALAVAAVVAAGGAVVVHGAIGGWRDDRHPFGPHHRPGAAADR